MVSTLVPSLFEIMNQKKETLPLQTWNDVVSSLLIIDLK